MLLINSGNLIDQMDSDGIGVLSERSGQNLTWNISGEDPPMPNNERNVLLLIADISGYTRFMTANRTSLAHSQIVITELMHTIIRQIELPLQIYKLEGDAVCLYLEKKGNLASMQMAGATLSRKLDRIFEAFHLKVIELIQSNL